MPNWLQISLYVVLFNTIISALIRACHKNSKEQRAWDLGYCLKHKIKLNHTLYSNSYCTKCDKEKHEKEAAFLKKTGLK